MNAVQDKKQPANNRNGVVAVEFSILAPIIFMIFAGCLELTAMNLIRHSAGNAAYEVARSAIVPGAVDSEARAVGENILNAVGATNNVTINISDNGRNVLVEVIVPVGDNSWGLGKFTGDLTIRKKCSLSREL